MSPNTFLVFNLILLAVVLESDLGRRKISAFRILRPLLGVAVITPFFLATPATDGWGLVFEVGGALLGLMLGFAATALLPVSWDPARRRVYTRAGLGYAALWVTVSAARYGFAYGAKHLFNHPLKDFMATNHVSAAALTDALIMVFVAMYLVRSLSLLTRRYTAIPAVPSRQAERSDPAVKSPRHTRKEPHDRTPVHPDFPAQSVGVGKPR